MSRVSKCFLVESVVHEKRLNKNWLKPCCVLSCKCILTKNSCIYCLAHFINLVFFWFFVLVSAACSTLHSCMCVQHDVYVDATFNICWTVALSDIHLFCHAINMLDHIESIHSRRMCQKFFRLINNGWILRPVQCDVLDVIENITRTKPKKWKRPCYSIPRHWTDPF